jgi:hypothetical protein
MWELQGSREGFAGRSQEQGDNSTACIHKTASMVPVRRPLLTKGEDELKLQATTVTT